MSSSLLELVYTRWQCLWGVSLRRARRPHEGVRYVKGWEAELIEHRTEPCIQRSEKSFEEGWAGIKTIFYIVPWKYRQSFLLLTCCHFSSGIESHKRKESNKDKSCVVTDQWVPCGKKGLLLYRKEKQEHPLPFSRELAQIEDLNIQAGTARQVLEQKTQTSWTPERKNSF